MNDIEFIKSIDIKTIISKETGLNFKNNTLKNCPFCGSGTGKNKSSAFSVLPNKNIFTCFSCDKKGGTIEFIREYKKLPNGNAIKYIVEHYTNAKPFEPVKEVLTDIGKKIYAIKHNDKSKATEYLKSRAIDCKKLPEDAYYYEKYKNAVVFFDANQQLINKRFIEPEPDKSKSIFDKGSKTKNALYNKMYDAQKDTVYIVEGVINSLSLVGYSSLAIFTTSNHFDNIDLLAKYLKNKNVVLAFDNDEAGQKCTDYHQNFATENIEVESLSKLLLPAGEDLNDLLKKKALTKYLADTGNYEYLIDNFLLKDSKEIRTDIKEFGFYRNSGAYWIEKKGKNDISYKIRISNFLMESLYNFNDGTNDTTRLMKLVRKTGETHLIEVKSSQTKRNDFQTILKSKRCMFKGGAYDLDSIFEQLMDNEKEAIKIDNLGYQKKSGLYAFADAVINPDNELKKVNDNGILFDNNRTYYLPAFAESNIDNDNYISTRTFRYKEGRFNFKEWAEHIYHSWGSNGAVAIQYTILGIFRDKIVNSLGFFPYLFLFGAFQTGKTQLMLNLMSIFGDDKGVDLGTVTPVGLSRSITQRTNSLFYFKEFTTLNADKAIPFILTTYDNVGKITGAKSVGNETHNILPKSAAVFDGNFLPVQRDAVYSRLIVLNFESRNFTDRQKESFNILEAERAKGFSQVLRNIHKYRNIFETKFKTTFLRVEKDPEIQFQARFKRHAALILTAYELLKDVLPFPYSYNELIDKIVEYTETQSEILNEIQDISVFWQAVEHFKSKSEIHEGNHYLKEIEHDSNIGFIYIRYSQLYPYYLRYCKENSYNIVDKTSLKELLTSNGNPAFIAGTQKSRKGKAVTKSFEGAAKSAYRFKYFYENGYIKINDLKIDL